MPCSTSSPDVLDEHSQRLAEALSTHLRDERGDLATTARIHLRHAAPLLPVRDRQAIADHAVAIARRCGSLEHWLANPRVKEVMVNDGRDVFIEDEDGLRRVGNITPTETDSIIQRILLPHGKRADRSSPMVDTRLLDGSRVCIVVPPVTHGPCISIRRFTHNDVTLDDFGDAHCTQVLLQLLEERRNIIVSGAASSGKTTLLNILARHLPHTQRIVVIEDVRELTFALPNVVRLEAQPSGAEGSGGVSLQSLVRTALRLRPDRLVVGEVRGAEVLDLIEALDTGHAGSMGTCHASSGADALERLALVVMRHNPQWHHALVATMVHRVLDAVVHLERDDTGRRFISHVICVPKTPATAPHTLFQRGAQLRAA